MERRPVGDPAAVPADHPGRPACQRELQRPAVRGSGRGQPDRPLLPGSAGAGRDAGPGPHRAPGVDLEVLIDCAVRFRWVRTLVRTAPAL
ncbi:hypothetical protein G6F21_014314 [Rhizopus arrhizus]|nr:hypothetical protein G6F21_014314 [Rhizopus arrhizus]